MSYFKLLSHKQFVSTGEKPLLPGGQGDDANPKTQQLKEEKLSIFFNECKDGMRISYKTSMWVRHLRWG